LPIILYGKRYWGGLVDWMRQHLLPRYIDREDLDIFRIVDTPEEAVRLAKTGVKHHWWRPTDDALVLATGNGDSRKKNPLAGGAKSGSTGEGTRYGRRPKRSTHKHAKAMKKPQQ
jgi:hypothetical protein